MLQAVLDGQVRLSKKVDVGFKKVNKRIGKVETNLTKRIDTLGAQLAYLDDDTPTRKEHDKLEKRVIVTEHQIASM